MCSLSRLDPAFTFVRFRSHTSDLNIELEVQDPAGNVVSHSSPVSTGGNTAIAKSLLSPFSVPSIASIKSAISGSSTSLSTNGASDYSRASNGLTDNFDNPIFRLFSQETAVEEPALTKPTSVPSHQSSQSNE